VYISQFLSGIILALVVVVITLRKKTLIVNDYWTIMIFVIIGVFLVETLSFGLTAGIVSGLGSVLTAAAIFILRFQPSE
jgi:hypothetical protein